MSASYKIVDDVEMVEVDNEYLIIDTARFTITKINTVGSDIIGEVIKNRSLDDMVQTIQRKYGNTTEQVKEDVTSFLEELEKVGLVWK